MWHTDRQTDILTFGLLGLLSQPKRQILSSNIQVEKDTHMIEQDTISISLTNPNGRTYNVHHQDNINDSLRRSSSLPDLSLNLIYALRWVSKLKKRMYHDPFLKSRNENAMFYSTISLSKLQKIMRKRHSSPEVLNSCFVNYLWIFLMKCDVLQSV